MPTKGRKKNYSVDKSLFVAFFNVIRTEVLELLRVARSVFFVFSSTPYGIEISVYGGGFSVTNITLVAIK